MGEDLRPEDLDPPTGDVDAQIADRSHRFVDEGLAVSAYEDLGAGNPLERRVKNLMGEIQAVAYDIDTNYRPVERRDYPIFKLVQALNIVVAVSLYNNGGVEQYVNDLVKGAHKFDREDARNMFVWGYESLGLLSNAFSFAQGTTQLNETSLEQFTTVNARSDIWTEPRWTNSKEQMLRAINDSYQLIGAKTSPSTESIRGFITKLRLEILRQGLGLNISKEQGTRLHPNQDNAIKNARKKAREEFNKRGGSLLMTEAQDQH